MFWSEAFQKVSDHAALIAGILTSPWLGIGMLLFGIGYLLFVGEPKYTLRHPIWPIIGWTVVGVVALMFWTVMVGGHAAVRSSAQVDTKIGQLSEQLARLRSPGITEDQQKKMAEVLKAVPPGVIYKLVIASIAECRNCGTYANGLQSAWDGIPGWSVEGYRGAGLNPEVAGVLVDTALEGCPPDEVQLIENALRAADIVLRRVPLRVGNTLASTPEVCVMFVGNK